MSRTLKLIPEVINGPEVRTAGRPFQILALFSVDSVHLKGQSLVTDSGHKGLAAVAEYPVNMSLH